MSAQIRVRAATEEDVEALVGFNQAMAKETESRDLSAELLRPGVAGVFAQPARGFYLVAEASDGPRREVAGGLMVTYEWSDWRNGSFWWVQSVYVLPQWRRHGIYKALYAEVKAQSQQAGNVCGIRLYVERENLTAQRVYQTLGMHATVYHLYEEEFPA